MTRRKARRVRVSRNAWFREVCKGHPQNDRGPNFKSWHQEACAVIARLPGMRRPMAATIGRVANAFESAL